MSEEGIIEYIKIKLEHIIPEYTETLVDGKPYRIENLQLETNWTKRTAEKVQGLLDLYNNLKEIEEEHRKLNGELRVELEKEKEKNKELEQYKKYYQNERNLLDSYIPKERVREAIKVINKQIDGAIDCSKGGLDGDFIKKGSELLAQKRILQSLLLIKEKEKYRT